MIEQLRILGVKIGFAGTGIMEKFIRKQVTTNQLSDKEIQEVLAAWETRNYVPASKVKQVDTVKPVITKEEVEKGLYSQKEYDRNYVEMIEKYLHTII